MYVQEQIQFGSQRGELIIDNFRFILSRFNLFSCHLCSTIGQIIQGTANTAKLFSSRCLFKFND